MKLMPSITVTVRATKKATEDAIATKIPVTTTERGPVLAPAIAPGPAVMTTPKALATAIVEDVVLVPLIQGAPQVLHLTTKNDPLPYISYYNINVIYCK